MSQERYLRSLVFQDLDNLVENGYADDWNGTGQSIYDADPTEVIQNAIEETGADYQLDEATEFVKEWQKSRGPKP